MTQHQLLLVAKSIKCPKKQFLSLLKLNGKSERVVEFTRDGIDIRVVDLIMSTINEYNNASASIQMSGILPQPVENLVSRKPTGITFAACRQHQLTLQQRADQQGRSLANLIAHLFETAFAG